MFTFCAACSLASVTVDMFTLISSVAAATVSAFFADCSAPPVISSADRASSVEVADKERPSSTILPIRERRLLVISCSDAWRLPVGALALPRSFKSPCAISWASLTISAGSPPRSFRMDLAFIKRIERTRKKPIIDPIVKRLRVVLLVLVLLVEISETVRWPASVISSWTWPTACCRSSLMVFASRLRIVLICSSFSCTRSLNSPFISAASLRDLVMSMATLTLPIMSPSDLISLLRVRTLGSLVPASIIFWISGLPLGRRDLSFSFLRLRNLVSGFLFLSR